MTPSKTLKLIYFLRALGLSVALFFITTPAFAARYYLSENNNLIKGCSGTIEIRIDTEGSNVLAGDSSLLINPAEVKINQVSVDQSLPMQVFNQFTANSVKLSAARLPMSGPFNGDGVFGYINFTPEAAAPSGNFTFVPDLSVENNIADENINNVLTSAVSKTYTFRDPYNKDIDGKGFCVPDSAPPAVQFITPPAGSSGIAVDTNIILSISDDRTGVNLSSLNLLIDGIAYNQNSSQVRIQKDGAVHRVEVNPDLSFGQGKTIAINVTVCDLNSPANCTNPSASFRTFTPAPPPPVCGDGIITYQNGEQCDDGNTRSGDGCSSLCLWEAIVTYVSAPGGPSATCQDGLHNQGERGIDCGGPCPNPCPTCVDGLLNQGEESVDCGGPCPSCTQKETVTAPPLLFPETQKPSYMTICHFPANEPENPYNMVIPDTEWPFYQSQGDTIGVCPAFDLCSEALLQAAPEKEEEALKAAEQIIQMEGAVKSPETIITAPKTQLEINSQIDFCKQNSDYAGADFSNPSADTDGDGLSDRMECYAEFNPLKPDTDGDGCHDFEELNQYYTNPADPTDCKIEMAAQRFLEVVITDPQPGWILGTTEPEIGGKVPAESILVLVVATQSEQVYINNLLEAIDTVLNSTASDSSVLIQKRLDSLNNAIKAANEFFEQYGREKDYSSAKDIMNSITFDFNLKNIFTDSVRQTLEKAKVNLISLKVKPIVSLATTQFSDTYAGDLSAKYFKDYSSPLADKQIYDLVASAYLSDGSQISSKAVRFALDRSRVILKPVPRTIGGKAIPQEFSFLNSFFAESALAQGKGMNEIVIQEGRPTITGETEFGSQVFAIWNSVVLASSVISDSEQGYFEVKAPGNLEIDTPHKVTLYAVKEQENKKIRSESVDVYFRIRESGMSLWWLILLLTLIISTLISIFVIRRTIQIRSMVRVLKRKK